MAALIDVHGFLSSPKSAKAQITKRWLAKNRPDIEFYCPSLSAYSELAQAKLEGLIKTLESQTVYLIGSSLGGFWSTHLIERCSADKAVLINPAVAPHTRFSSWVGETFQSYYSDDTYELDQTDIDKLAELDCATLTHPEKYWLMVQTGDETLDYRDAVQRYRACKQLVEEGGDHSFSGYQDWLPAIIEFLEA